MEVLVVEWEEKTLDDFAGDILTALILSIVRKAATDQTLEELLHTAIEIKKSAIPPAPHDTLLNLLAEVRAINQLVPPQEFSTDTCLPRRKPMVNRTLLHNHLQRLTQANTRILMITGEGGLGKSHSIKAITHHSMNYDDVDIAVIDLGDYDQSVSAPVLAEALATKLNLGALPVSGPEQSTNWSSQCCDVLERGLRNFAQQRNRKLWIVFDSIKRSIAPSAIAFLESFSKRVDNDLTDVRLILIDYPHDIPAVSSLREEIGEIDLRELVAFLIKAHTELELEVDVETLSEMAAEIWSKVNKKELGWMRKLHDLLCEKLLL